MNLYLIAITFATLCFVNGLDVNNEWKEFKIKYGKTYPIPEDSNRKLIFTKNFEQILKHNKLYDQGLVSFKLGINQFSDLTNEEFKKSRLGFERPSTNSFDDEIEFIVFQAPDVDIPNEVDWREIGAVTEVKDQRVCGFSWPFGATGALEGQYFRKTNNLVSLSELNIAECSNESGCSGGDIISGFKYVHNNDGIDSEDGYSSTPNDGQCKFDVETNVTSMTNRVLVVKDGSEESLKVAVALYGPLAVAIEANQISFQTYTSGIYYEANCTPALDHFGLVVGYGTENGEDYWIVKNSWGQSWGENGYIRMARNRQNNCGIASFALLPILY